MSSMSFDQLQSLAEFGREYAANGRPSVRPIDWETLYNLDIDRDFILQVAAVCKQDGNEKLRSLLLTVAGMLNPEGEVTDEPAEYVPWGIVSSINGAFGRGFNLVVNAELRGKLTP